jgi:hypothetical protein
MTRGTVALAGLLVAWIASSCDKPSPPPRLPEKKTLGVADLEPPTDAPPPVNSENYEDGYNAGVTAGENAARALPPRSKAPKAEELAVFALEAAGTDTTHGPRWQRGYVSGYRDGFDRISNGRK